MKYRSIEFVDGGDSGRAPISYAVAKRWLYEKKINGVRVASSGTLVNFLDSATGFPDFMVFKHQILRAAEPYLGMAADIGAITEEQVKDLRAGKRVREIVIPVIKGVSADEQERTREILRRKGLLPYVDLERLRHPKQTVARPDAGLILTIGV